jgi:hypothetical protein
LDKLQLLLLDKLEAAGAPQHGAAAPFLLREASRLVAVLAARRQLACIVLGREAGGPRLHCYRLVEDVALPTTDPAMLVDGQLPRVSLSLSRVPPSREDELVAALEACLAHEARRGGWAGLDTMQCQLRDAPVGVDVPFGELNRLLARLSRRRELVFSSYARKGRTPRGVFRFAEDQALPTTDPALLVDGAPLRALRWLRVPLQARDASAVSLVAAAAATPALPQSPPAAARAAAAINVGRSGGGGQPLRNGHCFRLCLGLPLAQRQRLPQRLRQRQWLWRQLALAPRQPGGGQQQRLQQQQQEPQHQPQQH